MYRGAFQISETRDRTRKKGVAESRKLERKEIEVESTIPKYTKHSKPYDH